LTLLLSSCVSVHPDSGLNDVRLSVAARSNIDWQGNVEAMLKDDLTADEAVLIAVANNPRLQVTLAELGVARADLIEASTIANPLFEIEIRYPGEPVRPFELRLAQTLVDLVQLPRRRALGRAAFENAKMQVTADVLRFAAGVRASYFDLLAATQHVGMARTVLESAKTAAELAIKQHGAGNITDLDLENEQARYEQAKLDLARAEQHLVLTRESFLRATSLGTAEWRVPATFPALPVADLGPEQLEQLAAAQRLDLAIARRNLELAEKRVPLARLAALGTAEADVHYEREPDGKHTAGPGIVVPIPIFNTGRAARTRAEAEVLRARHTLGALTAESSSRLRTASAVVAEARARVEYYRDVVVPRRTRIVDLTKLEHNAMLVGIYQLLQAQQNETQARHELVDAQRDYWIARVDLDRALNGIATEAH
jgi:cobalt-zinc-cadmium efflux system outer membrane protein